MKVKEYPMISAQSLFFAHIHKLWMISAVIVLGVVIQKLMI
jgi:uncharacterized protein YdaL